jgi:Rab-GTPase-TBC domain
MPLQAFQSECILTRVRSGVFFLFFFFFFPLPPYFHSAHEEFFYHKLVERARGPGALSTAVHTQIRKDLERTLPGHAVFAAETGRVDLESVLGALALSHPDIGYCQSLNFVAGFLLLFTTPENTYWLLSTVVSRLLPNYFDRHMLGAPLDQQVLLGLVHSHLPKVWRVLQHFEVQLEVGTSCLWVGISILVQSCVFTFVPAPSRTGHHLTMVSVFVHHTTLH